MRERLPGQPLLVQAPAHNRERVHGVSVLDRLLGQLALRRAVGEG